MAKFFMLFFASLFAFTGGLYIGKKLINPKDQTVFEEIQVPASDLPEDLKEMPSEKSIEDVATESKPTTDKVEQPEKNIEVAVKEKAPEVIKAKASAPSKISPLFVAAQSLKSKSFVQVSAHQNEAAAQKMAKELSTVFDNSFYTKKLIKSKTWYRVGLGPFPSKNVSQAFLNSNLTKLPKNCFVQKM